MSCMGSILSKAIRFDGFELKFNILFPIHTAFFSFFRVLFQFYSLGFHLLFQFVMNSVFMHHTNLLSAAHARSSHNKWRSLYMWEEISIAQALEHPYERSKRNGGKNRLVVISFASIYLFFNTGFASHRMESHLFPLFVVHFNISIQLLLLFFSTNLFRCHRRNVSAAVTFFPLQPWPCLTRPFSGFLFCQIQITK